MVLGATHPNLVRDRAKPIAATCGACRYLGIENHVVFLDQFVDQATLLEFISMCDVHVTPYLNEAQMTSGTLAYSFGLGKPVVLTPYWHARELLAEGRGVLVPFGDAIELPAWRWRDCCPTMFAGHAMPRGAALTRRSMTWARTAERYI